MAAARYQRLKLPLVVAAAVNALGLAWSSLPVELQLYWGDQFLIRLLRWIGEPAGMVTHWAIAFLELRPIYDVEIPYLHGMAMDLIALAVAFTWFLVVAVLARAFVARLLDCVQQVNPTR